MAMNIKNERAEALARRAAALEGSSMTGAIIAALEEFIERRSDGGRPSVESLMALSRRTAPRWSKVGPAERAADFLYDSDGLPR